MSAGIFGRFRPFLLFLAIAAICVVSAGTAVQAQMQRALGVDATGFGKPVPAFAVAVPQGWQARGGIIWNTNDPCSTYGYDFSWAAVSQDQRYGVAMVPAMRWMSTPPQNGMRACPVMQIGSARDAISTLVSRILPNAQMIDYRPRPDLIREIGVQPGQFDLGSGAWIRTHVEAGEGLFSYSDERGTPMRATLSLVAIANETFLPGNGIMPNFSSVVGETSPAWAAFAPDGELNLEMSEKMRLSVRLNPEWQQAIMDHQAKINGDNRRTTAKIGEINREASEFVGRLSQEGFESRGRAIERGRTAFLNTINEREVWRDTDGSTLNAPAGGTNMWRLDDGSYLSSDNPNLNPFEATGQFGTSLERLE